MKDSIKAQPACGGRAGNDGVGAAGVNSAFNHFYYNTEAPPCQKEISHPLGNRPIEATWWKEFVVVLKGRFV